MPSSGGCIATSWLTKKKIRTSIENMSDMAAAAVNNLRVPANYVEEFGKRCGGSPGEVDGWDNKTNGVGCIGSDTVNPGVNGVCRLAPFFGPRRCRATRVATRARTSDCALSTRRRHRHHSANYLRKAQPNSWPRFISKIAQARVAHLAKQLSQKAHTTVTRSFMTPQLSP
jgi:hypothetical protein